MRWNADSLLLIKSSHAILQAQNKCEKHLNFKFISFSLFSYNKNNDKHSKNNIRIMKIFISFIKATIKIFREAGEFDNNSIADL